MAEEVELKDKEQQLRDRLTSRKEEHKLRNRLKSRQEERRRSLSMDPEDTKERKYHRDDRDRDRQPHHHRRDDRPRPRHHDRRREDHPRRSPYDNGPPRRGEDRHLPPYDPRYGPPPSDHYSHAPPPYHRRPPRPPPENVDPFGRKPRSRSRSRSVSSSSSASSRSSSSSRSHSSSSRSSRSSSSSSSGSSSASSASSRSSVLSSHSRMDANNNNNNLTKDQRTIFINQLIMRTTERDIKHYLKQHAIPIVEISMLRDKKTGRHKGCAYVELRHLDDVPKAVALSGQPPDFQRFSVLIKASEAEKNYIAPKPLIVEAATAGVASNTASTTNVQRVYIGNLDPAVSQEQLMALFEPFGALQKVALQTSSGISKGFAFLSFGDASAAYLAIQTMSGQTLLGRSMKTGWAQRAGDEQSDTFPANASQRAQQAYQRLGQINLGLMPSTISSNNGVYGSGTPSPAVVKAAPVGTVAEARASLAAVAASHSNGVAAVPVGLPAVTVTSPSTPADPKTIGNSNHPSPYLHVSNMFDKDQETEPDWAHEIQLDFEDESRKFGTLQRTKVLANQPGGQIYCQFTTAAEATACAQALAGRWFDRRLLYVEFVTQEEFEKHI